MTRFAWVIDQTKCIGCHACTTACKSENDVPLGVFRTWVKNVDVGTFPAVRRHFAVLRCNHCEDAPCVEICPVTAMYQRPDGLVDFDADRCIGCKACMQACPYDAIYMDPDSNTAAKCNFCSHRVDDGLLPACVVVCPVEALVFGDLHDPTSKVSRELATHPSVVRRPEQNTRPKAFYIGAHEATIDPLAATHTDMYMWADRHQSATTDNGHKAAAMPARVAYDIPRQRAWAGKVSSYIWTKSLAAGGGLAAAAWHLGGGGESQLFRWFGPLLGMAFLAITGVLLIADLKRPERFWTILTRPQWRSWLARGAFVITLYGMALAAWIAAEWFGATRVLDLLAIPMALLALASAVYTAFLFRQCEGRDLWQSWLMFLHLGVHGPVAAAAAILVAAPWLDGASVPARLTIWTAVGLVVLAVLAGIDGFGGHPTPNAKAAAYQLARGRQASLYWPAVAGMLIPAAMLGLGVAPAIAGVIALGALWLYGHALVLAGQGPPIS